MGLVLFSEVLKMADKLMCSLQILTIDIKMDVWLLCEYIGDQNGIGIIPVAEQGL